MDTPILDMLNGAASGARVRFCMPGHKGKAAFLSGDVDTLDITEIPGTDNLYHPEGAIRRSQQHYAASIGAKHAFYLVNGSSCGLQAAFLSAVEPGDKIITVRDLHLSAVNAFILSGAKPYFIKTRRSAGGLPNVVTPEDVEKAIAVNPDAKAVLVTYPNYYGLCVDLETITAMAHEAGMLMICDAAHAAAFDYSQQLPASPSECGCDLWVTSLHKTLPAMNQCAALLVGKGCTIPLHQIQSRINMVQTTSPSFLLLGSAEYATGLMIDEGPYLLSRTVDMVHDAIWRIGKLGGYRVVTADVPYETGAYDRDILRMVIDVSDRGLTGIGAERDLHRRGVVIEGADLSHIILICTIADSKEDFEHLVRAMQDIKGGIYSIEQPMTNVDVQKAIVTELEMPMREASLGPREAVPMTESVGRICAVPAGAFPPGVPLVLPGQKMTAEVKDILERLRQRGYGTFGFGETIQMVKQK